MPDRFPEYYPGQVLPGTKYQIVKELGAGGMGVVYQVVKPPQIQGVLKLMAAELAGHEDFRRRFLDEVHVLAQLDHPNIVKVFDYDSLADGTPFYVMELLQGRTVRDVIATVGRVAPRVAFEITRQLCEALHCAHTHSPSVVHRDIKPENIFLHAPKHGDPLVKLIDFGVVAISGRAHDGTFVGTWKYAAPEQIRGERTTPATDLYAVGLVLYEMLAGAGPFDHIDTGQLISQAHLREAPAPITSFAPWLPPSIVALIDSALSKDPGARPRDAYAFAERLFELEWANDGKNPHDRTAEGPLLSVLTSPRAARVEPAPQNVPHVVVPGPMRHKGPTLPGVGEGTAIPGEDDLLAALVARPDVPMPSRKSTPEPPRVVVRPSGPGLASATRGESAPTLGSDTFASQQSDPKGVPLGRRSALVLPLALVAALVVVGLGGFFAMRGEKPEPTRMLMAPTPAATPSATPSAPPPPPAEVPSAVPTTPPVRVMKAAPTAKPSVAPTEPRRAPPPPATTSPPKGGDDGYLRGL